MSYLVSHNTVKHLFDFMTSQDPKWLSGIEGIAVPFFDEWLPPSTPRGVSTLFTTLMEVNPSDRREMFAITDIEEIEFHPDIIPFLKGEYFTLLILEEVYSI